MELKAIIMGILGFLLLYGGLVACIGIAWYHGKRKKEGPNIERPTSNVE